MVTMAEGCKSVLTGSLVLVLHRHDLIAVGADRRQFRHEGVPRNAA